MGGKSWLGDCFDLSVLLIRQGESYLRRKLALNVRVKYDYVRFSDHLNVQVRKACLGSLSNPIHHSIPSVKYTPPQKRRTRQIRIPRHSETANLPPLASAVYRQSSLVSSVKHDRRSVRAAVDVNVFAASIL